MLEFVKLNVNPKNRKTGDCSTRALCQATNVPWTDVLKMQCDEALRSCYDPTSDKVFEALLEKMGFTKVGKPFKANGKTYCVCEMDGLLSPTDIAVLKVANHWVCAKGGQYIDTWDCGCKSVYGYYVKRNCPDKDLRLYANGKAIRINIATNEATVVK